MNTYHSALVWGYIIDAIFFADMLVTFNVPYYSREIDDLVVDRQKICTRYISFWFWIDLISALPFDEMIDASITSPQQLRSVKLVRIIRLTRLGKLYKLTKFGHIKDFLDNKNISPAFMSTLTLFFQVVLYAHLICCFWFFITTSDVTGVMQPPDPPLFDDVDGYTSTSHSYHFPIRTWATEFGYEYASVSSQYIASLYFTFTTLFTVGYGDIHATNTGERFYCIMIEFTAAICFSAVIARVKAVVDSQNLNSKALRAKMEDFKAYLEEKNVNIALKTIAKESYAHYLQKVPSLGEFGFYDELPKIIKNRFVQHKFMREIRHIHWFRNSDINMIAQVIVFSKPQQASVGEIIYNVGDYAEEIGKDHSPTHASDHDQVSM